MRQLIGHIETFTKTQLAKGAHTRLLILVLGLALSVLTVGVMQTQASAQSVEFDSAWGTFHSPERPQDELAIECIQYGTDEPATFDTDPSIQTEAPEILNQIRTGRIPEDIPFVGGTCSGDPGAETGLGSSGLGFIGANGQNFVDEYFEISRLFHFNRTVERSLRTAELAATITLTDPATGDLIPFDVDYLISIHETSDFAGVADTSLCEFDVPENRIVTELGIDGTLCADQLTITQTTPRSIEIADSSVTLNIAGFARVEDGECDPTQLVTGDSIFTAEQDANPLCLLGTLVFTPLATANNANVNEEELLEQNEAAPATLADTGNSYWFALASGVLFIAGFIVLLRRGHWAAKK